MTETDSTLTFRGVIFDLDGTLLDTLADLANATNAVLTRHGFPTHPVDAYRYFVGDGVQALLRRALPPEARDNGELEACAVTMREEYERHLNVLTKPYSGIEKLLDELAARGLKLAVFSNKPHEFTERCVHEFFGAQRFDPIIGHRPQYPRKPDPSGVAEIAGGWNVAPREILYLGDTGTDMQTAARAGAYPVGALWGFREQEELTAEGARALAARPEDVLSLLTADF